MLQKLKYIAMITAIVLLICLSAYSVSLLLGQYRPLDLAPDPENTEFRKEDEDLVLDNDYVTVRYRLSDGYYAILYDGYTLTQRAYSYAVVTDENGKKAEYDSLSAKSRAFFAEEHYADGFGTGIRLSVINLFDDIVMKQNFYLYDRAEYLRTEILLSSTENGKEIASNDMREILSGGKSGAKTAVGNMKQMTFLEAPFDNNDFENYSPRVMGGGKNYGYGFALIYNEKAMEGLVIGALHNGVFKNAVYTYSSQKSNTVGLDELYVHYGMISYESRDYDNVLRTEATVEHGYVSGTEITSPSMFYGYYADYRNGLEQYGDAAGIAEPPLAWEGNTPVGYNSWAALGFDMSYKTMTEMSDYIKTALPNYGKDADVYLNMDSGFESLTADEKSSVVGYINANGQKAGTYWTPFSYWGWDLDSPVLDLDGHGITDDTGAQYYYRDLVLRDGVGSPIGYSGAYSLDPTHPGTLKRIDRFLDLIIDLGYEYLKMDFVNNASMEGTHYNPCITTGMAAYNYGMEYIYRHAYAHIGSGKQFFLNVAISPVFSGQWVHSRRIACDAFEKSTSTSYLLNTLTYAWWMNGRIISISDPDHLVLYRSHNTDSPTPASGGEAAAGIVSRLLAGSLFMWSDNLVYPESKKRAESYLNNTELMSLALNGESFRPMQSGKFSEGFYLLENDTLYTAFFNFNPAGEKYAPVRLSDYGLSGNYAALDLVSGKKYTVVGGNVNLLLTGTSAVLLKIYRV
ncbi:MAG: hypothetical protein LBT20_03855 [Clostridiales bacterium]|nr:hypothetical protein [Clostridiales bacterium]